MNTVKSVFLPALVAIALSGCMGGKDAIKPQIKPMDVCVFPDVSNMIAPPWVCDAPVVGVTVSAVGFHEKSAAGPAFMKEMATASARVALAQQMRVHVNNMVKIYAETTGAAATETVDKVNTNVSKLITEETISGSRVFRSVTSPSGGIYVLVGLDPAVTKEATEQILKTSMNKDQALWQQFKAEKGQDELAAEIAKTGK